MKMETFKLLCHDFKEEWKDDSGFRITLMTLFIIYVILLIVKFKLKGGSVTAGTEIIINAIVTLAITIIGAFISYKLAVKQSNLNIKKSELKQRSLDNWNRELNELERLKTEWKNIILLVDNICCQAVEFCTNIKTSVKSIQVNKENLDAIDYKKITKDLHDLNFKLMDLRQLIKHSDYDNSENKNKLYNFYQNVVDASTNYYDNFVNYQCVMMKKRNSML